MAIFIDIIIMGPKSAISGFAQCHICPGSLREIQSILPVWAAKGSLIMGSYFHCSGFILIYRIELLYS